MKGLLAQNINEIVGLTIMALMALALVGGQFDAKGQEIAAEEPRVSFEIGLTIDD